jgi:hypothetical protein
MTYEEGGKEETQHAKSPKGSRDEVGLLFLIFLFGGRWFLEAVFGQHWFVPWKPRDGLRHPDQPLGQEQVGHEPFLSVSVKRPHPRWHH